MQNSPLLVCGVPVRHLPNALTILRIALTPAFIALLLSKKPGETFWALAVFGVAIGTDWLDGRIARAYNCKTRLGQFLDPLADKLLVLGAFVALTVLHPESFSPWAVAVIALRDATMTALRIWLEFTNRPLAVIQAARVKTFAQGVYLIVALSLVGLRELVSTHSFATSLLESRINALLLWGIALLTAYTGVLYLSQQVILLRRTANTT